MGFGATYSAETISPYKVRSQTMSSSIQFIALLVLGSIPIARSLTALRRCTQISEFFADEWHQEYETRLCGEILATSANLSEAVGFISDLNPDLSRMARVAADDLRDRLRSRYSEFLLQNPNTCQTAEGSILAAVIHKEHHTGQPKHWPNWRVRIVDLHSEIPDATR